MISKKQQRNSSSSSSSSCSSSAFILLFLLLVSSLLPVCRSADEATGSYTITQVTSYYALSPDSCQVQVEDAYTFGIQEQIQSFIIPVYRDSLSVVDLSYFSQPQVSVTLDSQDGNDKELKATAEIRYSLKSGVAFDINVWLVEPVKSGSQVTVVLTYQVESGLLWSDTANNVNRFVYVQKNSVPTFDAEFDLEIPSSYNLAPEDIVVSDVTRLVNKTSTMVTVARSSLLPNTQWKVITEFPAKRDCTITTMSPSYKIGLIVALVGGVTCVAGSVLLFALVLLILLTRRKWIQSILPEEAIPLPSSAPPSRTSSVIYPESILLEGERPLLDETPTTPTEIVYPNKLFEPIPETGYTLVISTPRQTNHQTIHYDTDLS